MRVVREEGAPSAVGICDFPSGGRQRRFHQALEERLTPAQNHDGPHAVHSAVLYSRIVWCVVIVRSISIVLVASSIQLDEASVRD